MRCILTTSATLIGGLLLVAAPLHAGDRNKEKHQERTVPPALTPAERIEPWLKVLKSERRDDRRARAAEELGKLATPNYPEIGSALIDALVRDDSASVRKAVVKTLADIDPPTHEIKEALDQAVKQDKSWLVRQAARMAVWRYKPQDDPPSVPGPRLRNTSKPTANGKLVAATKSKAKADPPADPLKSTQPPLPVLPVLPSTDNGLPPLPPPPLTNPGEPSRLTAPRPN